MLRYLSCMKECGMRGVMGEGCRKDPGDNKESCALWQTVKLEMGHEGEADLPDLPKGPDAVSSLVNKRARGCPFQREISAFLQQKTRQ